MVAARRLGLRLPALFAAATLWLDGLTVHFFFAVLEDGSWAEIGASISHFVIAVLFNVFLALVYAVAAYGWLRPPPPLPPPTQQSAPRAKIL